MMRLELFANLSVKEEIILRLESFKGFRYTLIPVVQGKGTEDWKLGTTVWPEENFLLISYIEDEEAQSVLAQLTEVKKTYPKEGICFFTMTVN